MAKSKKTKMPVESLACDVPRTTSADKARQRKYEVEDALRTMQRAGEIKSDKSLVKEVKALAKEQAAALAKVAK